VPLGNQPPRHMEELAGEVRVNEEEFSGHRKLGKSHSGRRVAELTRICPGLYNNQYSSPAQKCVKFGNK
jgi:hypothetical protein